MAEGSGVPLQTAPSLPLPSSDAKGAPADFLASADARQTFLNRIASQLEFNHRVLLQAADPEVPLLERLRFLCVFSSNLDEFYEIRVAGLKEQIKLQSALPGPDGLDPRQVYALLGARARKLVAEQYRLFNDVLVPELAAEGIRFLRRPHWSAEQAEYIREFFFRELMPMLTPIGLDPAHPFPRVLNKSLNFAVELEGKDAFGREAGAAIVQAPRALPRVILLPSKISGCPHGFVFLSSILHAHVGELFPGMRVRGCYQFRVTRNSELFVDEDEVRNLRDALQGELPQRHLGDAVRLEVADNCSPKMTRFLQGQFGLEETEVFAVNGPVNLVRLLPVPDSVARDDLKYPPCRPGLPKALQQEQTDMFRAIRDGDILLHHPYQSFAPVVDFIRQAAEDPDVMAIKQTVYRAGNDSALLDALIGAARRGKEVSVVVELLARFDEEANMNWAAQLEEAGAHVVYGVVGYKAHAKMALVVRREGGKLRRYVHLSTGNYHSQTARNFTDIGLFTCKEAIAADVANVFSQLTGLGHPGTLAHLWQSPFTMHAALIEAIRREARHARAGRKGLIIAKMNALLEPKIIEALYQASCDGVKIELIVRGACALRPGLPGLSENIRVRSVLGRFLEHERIFYFYNDKAEDVRLSSADWMERDFFRRVEICFPVLDKALKKRVIEEGLKRYLKDNRDTWELEPDGSYRRRRGRRLVSAQDTLMNQLA
ncbi:MULTISPECIES: polyphosphate kinase 1 [Cupriavidus]|uniref:polyphosphate kinase 1 n=1 Tax=Cupriavidus TaxID=106589 RepID=UPI0003A4B8BA|nr:MULTISPECIES: polyphosphate kinase 1 [Cupriavidus]